MEMEVSKCKGLNGILVKSEERKKYFRNRERDIIVVD